MSSRYLQEIAIRQKIERLQAQLEYLEKIDSLESSQNMDVNPTANGKIFQEQKENLQNKI